MKILSLHLTRLHNEEHFQLMIEVKGLIIASAQPVTDALSPVYTLFSTQVDREDQALEQLRKSIYTEAIVQADEQRDGITRSILHIARAYEKSITPSEVDAARHVLTYLDHYGDFTRKSYNEETAIIHNLVSDLTTYCAADLVAIHLGKWVNDLHNVNTQFENLMNTRYDEAAGRDHDDLQELRKAVDESYEQMVSLINAAVIVHGEADFAGFIYQLNERIHYYKTTLARRQSNKHPNDGEAEL